jgi:SAM-dependent methyltransferase
MNKLINSKNYSKIISAENYNNIMTNQHIYMKYCDKILLRIINSYISSGAEDIVKIGCGPARFLQQVAKTPDIRLTGIDTDSNFIEYSQLLLEDSCTIQNADIINYTHPCPVDIFYSHGLHHHVPKNEVKDYLKNIVSNLKDSGVYILVDEFLPEYTSGKERELKTIIWYGFVIGNAIKNNYLHLAQEESKTLIDDLNEGRKTKVTKDGALIQSVMAISSSIYNYINKNMLDSANELARDFLINIFNVHYTPIDFTENNNLSREDFKICHSVLESELIDSGLKIKTIEKIGDVDKIGGFSIYILEKSFV